MYQKVTIFVITSIRCGRCIEYERFSSFMSRLLSSSSSLCQVAAAVIEYESNQRFTFNYLEMHQFYNEVVIMIMIVVVTIMLTKETIFTMAPTSRPAPSSSPRRVEHRPESKCSPNWKIGKLLAGG